MCVKVYEKEVVNVGNYNQNSGTSNGSSAKSILAASDLKVPCILGSSRTSEAKCKRAFSSNAHWYFIHSVSACSDQATFITADDLSVYVWDLERADSSLRTLDIRPAVPEEQDVHPTALTGCPVQSTSWNRSIEIMLMGHGCRRSRW